MEVVNSSRLKNYSKDSLKKLKLEFSKVAEAQKDFCSSLNNFIKAIFDEGFFANGIDQQNIQLGNKELEALKDILMKTNVSVNADTIGNVASELISDIFKDVEGKSDLDKRVITSKLAQEISSAFDSIEKKVSNVEKKSLNKEKSLKTRPLREVRKDIAKKYSKRIIKISKSLSSDKKFQQQTVGNFTKLINRIRNQDEILRTNFLRHKANTIKFFDKKILFGEITRFRLFNRKRLSIEKTLVTRPAKFMRLYKYRASKVISKFVFNVKSWISVAFGLNVIMPIVKVIKFSITKIYSIVNLGIKGLFKVLNFASGLLIGIKNVAIKTLSKTAKMFKFVLEKTGIIAFFKLTAKLFMRFFKTYVGAYVLGYVAGTIWKNAESLFRFFREIGETIKDFAERAKKQVSEMLDGTWLGDMESWLMESYSFSKFLSKEIWEIIGSENLSIKEKIDKFGGLFTLRDSKTQSKIDVDTLIKDAGKFLENTTKILDGDFLQTAFRKMTDFGITLGSGMLGATIGSSIGAFLGTSIPIPGASIITGIIGSYVGGELGERIGNIILKITRGNVPLKNVKSIEDPFHAVMRQAGFLKFSGSFGATSETKSGELEELVSFAKRWEDEPDLGGENFRAALEDAVKDKRFSKKYANKLSISNPVRLRSELKLLSNIDNISYEDILEEINDNIAILKDLYESKDKSTASSIYSQQLNKDSYFKSDLSLGDDQVSFDTFDFASGKDAYNPIWLKIGRALRLRELLLMFKSDVITPSEFLDLYKDLENPNSPQYNDIMINVPSENGYNKESISEQINPKSPNLGPGKLRWGRLMNSIGAFQKEMPSTEDLLFLNTFSSNEGQTHAFSYDVLSQFAEQEKFERLSLEDRMAIVNASLKIEGVSPLESKSYMAANIEAHRLINEALLARTNILSLYTPNKSMSQDILKEIFAAGGYEFNNSDILLSIETLRNVLVENKNSDETFLNNLKNLYSDLNNLINGTKPAGGMFLFLKNFNPESDNWETAHYELIPPNTGAE